MGVVFSFPLMLLPDNVIQNVILSMDTLDIIYISLISKKTKHLVTSLKMQKRIDISVNRTIGISFNDVSIEFFPAQDRYWEPTEHGMKKKLKVSDSIQILKYTNGREMATRRPNIRNLDMKNWLAHFQAIFNNPNVDSIIFGGNSYVFDLDSVRETFPDVIRIKVRKTECEIHNRLVLEKFLPVKQLSIDTDALKRVERPYEILSQSFDVLEIDENSETPMKMTLDDLFMINSKYIEIYAAQISKDILNKFIKAWMKGSNTRMEHIRICDYGDVNRIREDVDVVMKGIKYRNMAENEVRVFKNSCSEWNDEIKSGMDVYRNDGRKATIKIRNDEGIFIFGISVWHDHCIA